MGVILLAGCSLGGPSSLADQDAMNRAEALGTRVAANRLFTADDIGRAAAGTPDVTVLSLTGKDARSTGVQLVIRVHGTGTVPLGQQEPTTVDECFQLAYRNSVQDGTPVSVSCPNVGPVSFSPLPPPPRLPDVAATTLRAALPTIPAGCTVTDAMATGLRATIDAWHLDPRVQRDVTIVNNTLGVALRTTDECLMGRAAPGSADTWYVSPRYYQPGELTCDAEEAANNAGR